MREVEVKPRTKLAGLDATRCFAALAIILFHLVRMPDLVIPQPLYFIKNYFGFGVPLFYIVSAFGLYVGYLGKIESRQDLHEYFTRRFSELHRSFIS